MNKKGQILLILFFIQMLAANAQDTIKVKKDTTMVYTRTDEIPQYPGGMSALYKFISSTIHFPERCKTDSLFQSCKVFLKFIINQEGSVSNIEVLKGCKNFPECDVEAIRVIKTLPKWKPAIVSNVPVKSYFTLPIIFKLQ